MYTEYKYRPTAEAGILRRTEVVQIDVYYIASYHCVLCIIHYIAGGGHPAGRRAGSQKSGPPCVRCHDGRDSNV